MLDETLQLGSSGDNVKILQEKLKILGFYNPVITGNFGLATLESVKAFQKQYGLEETGIVNSEMWDLLFELTEINYISTYSEYPTLSLGASGSYVRELQRKLKTLLYFTGEINSFFDNETQIAIKRFQFHNDLTTSGIATQQTWNLINSLYGSLNECALDNIEDNYITYIIQPGDTLYSIARRYNTTIDAIRALNNLTNDILSVGQVLQIPSSNENTSTITYIVQPGDTLYSIARRYNTTVDAIRALNNLTNDILSVGQVLQIPSSNENTSTITYIVQPGDTLYSIARRYNTTVDAITSLNNLLDNTLSIGQRLIIITR